MAIIKVEDKKTLKKLYDAWAMTWEGLRKEDFEVALKECCVDGVDGDGYVISGKLMNDICHLTGDNAYVDDLNIFSIPKFQGLAIQFGARWMADIIDNNSERQGYDPFLNY